MIYVNGEMLNVQEGLDQLEYSKGSHKKVLIKCDSGISEKCRKEYKTSYKEVIRYLRSDGRVFCHSCARREAAYSGGNPNTKYNLDLNFFKSINTPEKAWVAGWIASDGHLNKRGIMVSIHKKDVKCLEKIARIISPELVVRTKSETMVKLDINSRKMSEDLCNHFGITFGKKSHTVGYPYLKPGLHKHFIRGVFEGDGSIYRPELTNYPSCYIKTNSKNMIAGLLQNANEVPLIYKTTVNWVGEKALSFLWWLYSDCEELFLERKRNIYLRWIEKGYVKNKKHIVRKGFKLTDEHKKKISKGHSGDKSWRAKMNWDDVREIRRLSLEGKTHSQLSRKFGLSRSAIGQIVRHETWKE